MNEENEKTKEKLEKVKKVNKELWVMEKIALFR